MILVRLISRPEMAFGVIIFFCNFGGVFTQNRRFYDRVISVETPKTPKQKKCADIFINFFCSTSTQPLPNFLHILCLLKIKRHSSFPVPNNYYKNNTPPPILIVFVMYDLCRKKPAVIWGSILSLFILGKIPHHVVPTV